MNGPWMNDAAMDNKYQYNGKEINDDFGLGWNDYGARWYDASVGRWWTPDSESEKAMSLSTFRYSRNNPMKFFDPTGRFEIDENTAKQYPKLAFYLQHLSTTYENKPQAFRDAFKEYSELNDSQITDMLTAGKGPKIEVVQLGDNTNGATPMDINEKGEGAANGIIQIDIDIISNFEAKYLNQATGGEESDVAELALKSILFHEATHFGDISSDGKLTKTGISKGAFGAIEIDQVNNESGKNFERKAYGQDLVKDQKDFSDVRNYVQQKYPAQKPSSTQIQRDNYPTVKLRIQ